jgi:hypothetical protein
MTHVLDNTNVYMYSLVVISLVYKAYPNDCRYLLYIPAKAKALPREGAPALVLTTPIHALCTEL